MTLPLAEEHGFLPDLASVPDSTWRETAVLWLNYPNNPTAATASLEIYEQAAALAREHDFVVASDEAYSELYFGSTPPVSALQLPDLRNVAVFNTLSKRSSMPGYRSGFVAGDPELITLLKRYRPNVGVAPQAFVQRAAIAAWGDEAHVEAVRATYRAKRDVLLPVLEDHGLRSAGGDATFFLWLDAGPQADLAGRAAARGRDRPRAGLVLRRRRPRLPAAGARADARGVRARGRAARRAARLSRAAQRGVQRRVEAAPAAAARQRLDRARLRVAAEQQAARARELARP